MLVEEEEEEEETRMRVVGLLNCVVIFEGKLYNSGRWVEEEEEEEEMTAAAVAAVGEKMEVEAAIEGRYPKL